MSILKKNTVRMTSIRRFSCRDLFKFAQVNLDYFTETVRLYAHVSV